MWLKFGIAPDGKLVCVEDVGSGKTELLFNIAGNISTGLLIWGRHSYYYFSFPKNLNFGNPSICSLEKFFLLKPKSIRN
jgi:hypothetical protein